MPSHGNGPSSKEVPTTPTRHSTGASRLQELIGASALPSVSNIIGDSTFKAEDNNAREPPMAVVDPSNSPALQEIMQEPQFAWLQQFVSLYYPDGLPSHIDVHLLYWELRSSPGTDCRNHGTWKRVCRMLSGTIAWTLDASRNWKFRREDGRMPCIGPPSVVMAAVLLGSVAPGRPIRARQKSPRREILDLLNEAGLAFILQEPSNRMIPKFWEGADFDSFEWRRDNMRPWYAPIQRHKPAVDLNAYFRVGRYTLIKPRGSRAEEEALRTIVRKLDADYACFQKARKALLATLEAMPKCGATLDWVREKFPAGPRTAQASSSVAGVAGLAEGSCVTRSSNSSDGDSWDILEISKEDFAQQTSTKVGKSIDNRRPPRDLDGYLSPSRTMRDRSRSPPKQHVHLDHRGRPSDRMNPMDIQNLLSTGEPTLL